MTATLTRYRDLVDRSGESQMKGGQAMCSGRDCRADLNYDGRINALDRDILLGNWKSELCDVDINKDSYVDEADLTILSNTWSGTGMCHIEPLDCSTGIEDFNQVNLLQESLVTLGFTDADDFVTWWETADPGDFETTWAILMILMAQP